MDSFHKSELLVLLLGVVCIVLIFMLEEIGFCIALVLLLVAIIYYLMKIYYGITDRK